MAIDEYQDLGVPLHEIVQLLCFGDGRAKLLAVGDPDQSIYGFTGARPELLRGLAERQDVETVRLRFNYRSGPTLVRAAGIALGEERGYLAHNDRASTIDFHERPNGPHDEADFVFGQLIPEAQARLPHLALGDIAVMYLDRNDGDIVSAAATNHNINTIRVDAGAPYPKTPVTRWLEDCAAWCSGGWRHGSPRMSTLINKWFRIARLTGRNEAHLREARRVLVHFLMNHRNPDALLTTWLNDFTAASLGLLVEDPLLRDEATAVSIVASTAAPEGELSRWTVATFGGQIGSPDHLNLITLHSAKGLEFRVVIMFGMDEGKIPRWNATAIGMREPRRLFYVGLTRAQDEVHMTYCGWTENKYGRRFVRGPSRFLAEVRDRLAEQLDQ